MKRKIKILFHIVLSLVLCITTAAGALAAEPTITGGGTSAADPKVIVTQSEEAAAGGTAFTKVTETQWSDKDKISGLGTEYSRIDSTTTVKDSGGAVIEEYGFTQGKETITEEKTPAVTVTLRAGQETSAQSELQDSVNGQLKTDNPDEYDQTAITVDRQRSVTVVTGQEQVSLGDSSIETDKELGLRAVQPVWTGQEQDMIGPRPDRFGLDDTEGPAGYDYRYTGWDKDSRYGVWHITKTVVTDENGAEKEETTEKEADVIQFFLTDTKNPDEPDHTAYCADVCSGIKEGWWYRIDNLEEAGYYTDATAEDHIRAIANNGYWGTAEGTTGSLSRLRAKLADAQKNGSAEVKAMLEGQDFGKMTEGEAQAATQMAIWQYGHRYSSASELELRASNFNGDYGWTSDEEDEIAWARINAAAGYLASLTEAPGDTTQVITEDKFIESMSLTVKNKVSDDEGTYYADLKFSLAVIPGEKDSLAVQVLQDGQEVASRTVLPGQKEYTIENLVLAENQDFAFELKMAGAQYLEQGVYIYTSEVREGNYSQTFVGMAEGYRAVDIQMSMDLSYSTQDAIVTREHIWRDEWRRGSGQDSEPPTETTTAETTTQTDAEVTTETSAETTTESVSEETTESITETDTESTTEPESAPEDEAEEIIYADVPRTGDASGIWNLLSILSWAGLIGMKRRGRDK